MHEDDFYQIYLDELGTVTPYDEEEGERLAISSLQNDKAAGKRLIEGALHRALACAKEYEGRGLPIGDLIQEANMGLTLAAAGYEGGCWHEYSNMKMRQAIEEALEEQGFASKAEETVLARVNVLKEISQMMADELGREATVSELAGRMKMTEEEIKDIMKLTLDALSVSGE